MNTEFHIIRTGKKGPTGNETIRFVLQPEITIKSHISPSTPYGKEVYTRNDNMSRMTSLTTERTAQSGTGGRLASPISNHPQLSAKAHT